ncbi:hypothetical protein ACYCS5_11150 [Paenibacillus sp. SEL3]
MPIINFGNLVPVEDIKEAKQGEMNISGIYSVQKTAFFAISGSNLVLGVNEDVGFVQEKEFHPRSQ